MCSNRSVSASGRGSALLAALAFGLAAASAAEAQSEHDKPPTAAEPVAAPAKPSSVEGVTVNAPRAGSNAIGVAPADAAAFAAEAAKNEAWRKYRESMPPLTSNPNDQSKDFPGLKAYVPQ
jgi:hypothetical protein